MKVRCINVGREALLEADIATGITRSTVFHVTVGREYNVYGLLFTDATIRYLIEEDTGLPAWKPGSLFQIVRDRVSRSWRFVNWSSDGEYFGVMSYAELVRSPEAFDNLSLADDDARAVFFERKRSADLEFPDPSVEKAAQALRDDWLQCPFCSDAWEWKSLDAMVRCPSCQTVSQNPRYQAG